MRLDELLNVMDEDTWIRIFDKSDTVRYIYFGRIQDLEGDTKSLEVDKLAPGDKLTDIIVHDA